MTPRAVLIGLPGTGKSTTGRRLAKILAVAFADSDELVEQSTGRSVPELIDTDGESAFRELEADAVARALADFDGVLALGGGAVMTARTRAAPAVDRRLGASSPREPRCALAAGDPCPVIVGVLD